MNTDTKNKTATQTKRKPGRPKGNTPQGKKPEGNKPEGKKADAKAPSGNVTQTSQNRSGLIIVGALALLLIGFIVVAQLFNSGVFNAAAQNSQASMSLSNSSSNDEKSQGLPDLSSNTRNGNQGSDTAEVQVPPVIVDNVDPVVPETIEFQVPPVIEHFLNNEEVFVDWENKGAKSLSYTNVYTFPVLLRTGSDSMPVQVLDKAHKPIQTVLSNEQGYSSIYVLEPGMSVVFDVRGKWNTENEHFNVHAVIYHYNQRVEGELIALTQNAANILNELQSADPKPTAFMVDSKGVVTYYELSEKKMVAEGEGFKVSKTVAAQK